MEENQTHTKGLSFFSKKDNNKLGPPPKNKTGEANLDKFREDISNLFRTLRILEERYITLRKKSQLSDQSAIEDTNNIFTHLKLINQDIENIKVDIMEIGEKLNVFQKEIEGMASIQDLKVLQKYVEMWEPIDFITESEALKIIRDEINININNK